jgi:diguanylate cyclase (GGDEF)-like protein
MGAGMTDPWNVLDTLLEGVILIDGACHVLKWNRAASALFGWSQASNNRPLIALVQGLSAALEEGIREVRASGEWGEQVNLGTRWLRLSLTVCPWDESRFLLCCLDVSRARQAEARADQARWTDSLTNLPNREWFVYELDQRLYELVRVPGKLFAVAIVNLDRFKNINDILGHSFGDAMLRAVSERLNSLVRAPGKRTRDRLARFGGDEFILLLEGVWDAVHARAAAARLQRTFGETPLRVLGRDIYARITLGVVVAHPNYDSESLIMDADIAIRDARKSGGEQVVVFTEEMRKKLTERSALEEYLRRDVEAFIIAWYQANQLLCPFYIAYQPIMSLKADGPQLGGFEALVRWKCHDQEVSPARFIPVAEETGVILPLGQWVFEQACRQFLKWRNHFGNRGPQWININVAARQLLSPGYATEVEAFLKEIGLDPAFVCLEITESSFIEDGEEVRQVLEALTSLGIRLAMDDFGTGYSSFSYLHRMPFSALKIDQSFVRAMAPGNKQAQMVRTIVHLARDMGMSTTAEGVEDARLAVMLTEMGCPRAQGYFFSRPMTGENATTFIHQQALRSV